MAERRYAMIRVESGVYLLPSNDARTLWRLAAYTEDGSAYRERKNGTRQQIVGRYWAAACRRFPTDAEIDDLEIWGEGWQTVATLCPTRQAAIDEALGSGG